MGDRANILIRENEKDSGVYLYTHWNGTNLPMTLQAALNRGLRLDDCPYLGRIIFCEMLKQGTENFGKALDGETGYGISATVGDGEDRILVVDVDTQTVQVGLAGKIKWAFGQFIELSDKQMEKFWYIFNK